MAAEIMGHQGKRASTPGRKLGALGKTVIDKSKTAIIQAGNLSTDKKIYLAIGLILCLIWLTIKLRFGEKKPISPKINKVLRIII